MDSLNPQHARPGGVRQPVVPSGAAAGSRTREAFSELHAALEELSATLDDLDRSLLRRTDEFRQLRDDRRPDRPDVDLAA